MLGLLLAAALQVQPPERVTPLPGVVLTFTLNQAAYEVGEPILVTLRLTNRSNALFLMPVSNEITGWYDGYGVEVRRADGRLVEDPLHRRMRVMSNIVVDHPIEPGRWRVRELTLNHRVPVLQPGRYSVKATYRELTPRYGSRSTESPTA